jgi:hypothetical protein
MIEGRSEGMVESLLFSRLGGLCSLDLRSLAVTFTVAPELVILATLEPKTFALSLEAPLLLLPAEEVRVRLEGSVSPREDALFRLRDPRL